MASTYITSNDDIKAQHDGSEHLAINNTFLNRLFTLLALHTTAKFYSRDGPCVPLSKSKILKTGWRVHLTEAATMKYVAENTSTPVPKVYCSFIHKRQAYIVMERIQGEELPKAWKRLSEAQFSNIFE